MIELDEERRRPASWRAGERRRRCVLACPRAAVRWRGQPGGMQAQPVSRRTRPLGGPGSFGTVGLGGCRARALPEAGLAFAYLPIQLLDVNPDPRKVALSSAALTALG